MSSLTIIDDGRLTSAAATVDSNGVRLSPDTLHTTLGWELKAQGLCRDEVCIPVAGRSALVNSDGVDLAAFADLLQRPLALDLEERVAYLGASVAQRSQQLASLQAPDFTLPDLDGRPHSLSDYRGKKILLLAYASW
ncbi:MAG: redoxin domain-containing protein [Deltaproteobacteria bacterium]|nr:redoxin domain-containing protein [Deltaproteobacteria bacterium]